jgi:hypothetical protein
MNTVALSAGIFVLMIGGILIGNRLRSMLPEHHLNKESQDVLRLGVGLIATMAALVVGLLIASAKSSSDTQIGQVKQITADIILLDSLLGEYGPDARPIREQMRLAVPAFAERLWHQRMSSEGAPFEANAAVEKVYVMILSLSPQNDLQRSIQTRAVQIGTDIAQTRLLLFAESDNLFPLSFLAVLALWLFIIFASFSMFTNLNPTVFGALSLFALSAASAIFLILELRQPFTGVLALSSEPLRNVLPPI